MKKSVQEKNLVLNAVLNEIKKEDHKKIETGFEDDYSFTKKIVWKDNDEGYTPDIVVEFDNDTKNIYEIELDEDLNIDKWKLFSMYARKHKGEFFIVLPDWIMEKVKDEIKQNNISNVHLMYFKDSA
ncbi:MAG: hypothetical protein GVY19_06580 [Bacteroidetes bacterium]|jgi:hypothetical protein|nr:hypothetical protein [Bacteroidota bacterium]